MPKPHSGKGTLVLNALVPVALYYGLRAMGASVYLSLLAGAVVPAVTTAAGVIRSRSIDRLGAFMLTIMLFGVAVALIASPTSRGTSCGSARRRFDRAGGSRA